jgi:hypothetical protein
MVVIRLVIRGLRRKGDRLAVDVGLAGDHVAVLIEIESACGLLRDFIGDRGVERLRIGASQIEDAQSEVGAIPCNQLEDGGIVIDRGEQAFNCQLTPGNVRVGGKSLQGDALIDLIARGIELAGAAGNEQDLHGI